MSLEKILREGDIILFHSKGISPTSWGIRLLTESFWNHVGLYVVDLDTKGYVIEALGQGVRKTPIEKYIDNKHYVLKVVTLKESAFKDKKEYETGIITAIKRAREAVGTRYDWWAIVWLGLLYGSKGLWHKGSKWLPQRFNPFQSRNKFFCSELVCESCYGISSKFPYLFQGKTKQACDTTTPRDISKSSNVLFKYGLDVN